MKELRKNRTKGFVFVGRVSIHQTKLTKWLSCDGMPKPVLFMLQKLARTAFHHQVAVLRLMQLRKVKTINKCLLSLLSRPDQLAKSLKNQSPCVSLLKNQ